MFLFNKHVDIEYMGYWEMIKRSSVWRNHHLFIEIHKNHGVLHVYYTFQLFLLFFFCGKH